MSGSWTVVGRYGKVLERYSYRDKETRSTEEISNRMVTWKAYNSVCVGLARKWILHAVVFMKKLFYIFYKIRCKFCLCCD